MPVSGVANAGDTFSGTFLVQRFVPQANGVAATGTVAGVLTEADGSSRNLLFQATLPLDIASSLARLNTDPALAQSSCGVLHVELAGMQVNVLGSTIGLNPIAFDIASAAQAGAPASATTAGSSASQSATLTSPASANLTQASPTPQFATTVPTPGPPLPTAAAAAQPQTNLGSLLCAVDNFRNASNPTELVQQLNGIVTALGGSGS